MSGDLSLKNAAHNALLALAELHPINDVDPITTDVIPQSNRVVISTGYQFNIETLAEWFRGQARNRHLNNLQELFDGNHCANLYTRESISPEDTAHVWRVMQMHPSIDVNENLSRQAATTGEGHPSQRAIDAYIRMRLQEEIDAQRRGQARQEPLMHRGQDNYGRLFSAENQRTNTGGTTYPIVGNLSFKVEELATPFIGGGETHRLCTVVNSRESNHLMLSRERVESILRSISDLNALKSQFTNRGITADGILRSIVDAEREASSRPRGPSIAPLD